MHEFGGYFTRFFIANKKKVVIQIVNISKRMAHKLHKLGVRFGEGGISHSHTSNKKYYLCESRRNLDLLKRLENSELVKKNA